MSGVYRNIDPPPPHRHASVYPPPSPMVRGEDTLDGWRWGGGSIVRKTPDTALYSIYVSTLWPVSLAPAIFASGAQNCQYRREFFFEHTSEITKKKSGIEEKLKSRKKAEAKILLRCPFNVSVSLFLCCRTYRDYIYLEYHIVLYMLLLEGDIFKF
jgi:hypothetical protein